MSGLIYISSLIMPMIVVVVVMRAMAMKIDMAQKTV